jgi:hypothetical protein
VVRHFFINAQTGSTWELEDPISWCLRHSRDEPILAPASERLVTLGPADADRVVRLVIRRCRLNLLHVQPDRVLVHFWSRESRADLRPFCKDLGLTRTEVEVVLLRRKDEFVSLCGGDEFLYGEGDASLPWEHYRRKWQRRNEQEADDGTKAPHSFTNLIWEGSPEIPWNVLKCVWVREQAPTCPNCDTPQVMLRFWLRRRLWFVGLNSFLTRVCFTCRHVFVEDYPGNLLGWIVNTLDRNLWPTHHQVDRTYDLARDYDDLLNKLEDTGKMVVKI